MSELHSGEKITLLNGGFVTIKKELGRGGQGIVYLVDLNGQPKALKWYHNMPDRNFYNNLANNVMNGAPSPAFLWPERITERQKGSCGYVMALRPGNYFEFGNFLLAKKSFKSFQAMMAAAMKICNGFMMLHRFGYSYQDLNDGNFFIDPDTGDVMICDNDNVMPQGEKSGIMGKARYMAPEIVAGGIPDKYSDRFSLSVILFMLFYANHPFEGAKVVACPCMTEAFEKKFYGSEAVFIYNPNDKSNLPVRGIHQNVIRRWPVMPAELRETFIREFSSEMLKNPQKRMIEQNWEKLIASLRDRLVVCPHCGEETFIDESKPQCMNCKRDVDVSRRLKLGMRTMLLTNGTRLFIDFDNTPDARVTLNPQDKSMLLLQNLTKEKWTAETPSGKLKEVEPNGLMPVKNGIKVSFSPAHKGEIIINNQYTHIMSLLDETVSVPRRTMTLFFVIDTSGSMAGSKIGAVNDAVVNVLPMLDEISVTNPDAEIKVAALEFSTNCSWLYSEPKLASEFVWQDVQASGLTSLGAACEELENKLSRSKGFMQSASGSFAPAIILLSDGGPTDNFDAGLAKLKANNWFKSAIKVAIAIGEDADKDVLTKFTGTNEAVFTVHNIDALKQIIRVVAVTSSQIGSKSSTAGDTTKQDQVISEVQQAVDNIDGAEVATNVDRSSYTDDWD